MKVYRGSIQKGDYVYVTNLSMHDNLDNPLSIDCGKGIKKKEEITKAFDGCPVLEVSNMIIYEVGDDDYNVFAKRKYFIDFGYRSINYNLDRLIDAGHVFTTMGEAVFFAVSQYADLFQVGYKEKKHAMFEFAYNVLSSCFGSTGEKMNPVDFVDEESGDYFFEVDRSENELLSISNYKEFKDGSLDAGDIYDNQEAAMLRILREMLNSTKGEL